MTTSAHIPLDQLKIDESNIRQAGAGAEPVYIATIEQNGVIEPLIVRPNGTGYLVMQGGKRLASLQAMKAKGLTARGVKVTGDYPVPVVVRSDITTAAEAREVSLVTAICHTPVHPVDQYEAFAALADAKGGGLAPEDIARRFGCTVRVVSQRLALGRLSPKVRQAFRDGLINAEAAAAFTLTADHKHQDRIFDQMAKNGEFRWGNPAHSIKRAIAGKGQAGGAALTLIGIDAYEAAGGKVSIDLFKTNDSIISDPALLQKLLGEAIETRCTELKAAGWSWALPHSQIKNSWEYKGLNKKGKPTESEAAELARLNSIIKIIDDGEDADAAALAKVGITFEQLEDGEFEDEVREQLEQLENEIEGREFTDKDKARSGCTIALAQNGKLLITYGLIAPTKEPPRAADIASGSSRRTASAKAAPIKKPDISNALERDMKQWLAKGTRDAVAADKYKDDRAPLLAKLVAGQIDATPHGHYLQAFNDKEMAALRDQATPAVVKAAMAKAFDGDRYFAGVSAKLRLKHLAEMGHDGAAPKKASEAISLCKKLAASTSWLPPMLRWAHYDGPIGGKGEKSAKRKKAA